MYIKIKNLNAKYIQERERKKINVGKRKEKNKYRKERERVKIYIGKKEKG